MTLNVEIFNQLARILVGAALLAFALGVLAPDTDRNWIGWIGVIPILTGVVVICPLYNALGFSTR